MRCVYQGDALLDARMVADQLTQQGIEAEILGGHLPGGAGELPAGGQVRVMVAEEDVEAALRIVAEWERATAHNTREHFNASKRSRSLAGFVLGLITGISGVWVFVALPEPPETTRYFDHNQDQQPDTWHHYEQKRLQRVRKDRNFDGNVDAIWRYTDEGRKQAAELDQDFDGRRETRVSFNDNLVESREMDLDGDGRPDISEAYRHGVLRERRFHDPATGEIRKRTRYEAGVRPRESELDTTGDGITDTRIRYNRYGEPANGN
jgi:hypothetical protein